MMPTQASRSIIHSASTDGHRVGAGRTTHDSMGSVIPFYRESTSRGNRKAIPPHCHSHTLMHHHLTAENRISCSSDWETRLSVVVEACTVVAASSCEQRIEGKAYSVQYFCISAEPRTRQTRGAVDVARLCCCLGDGRSSPSHISDTVPPRMVRPHARVLHTGSPCLQPATWH